MHGLQATYLRQQSIYPPVPNSYLAFQMHVTPSSVSGRPSCNSNLHIPNCHSPNALVKSMTILDSCLGLLAHGLCPASMSFTIQFEPLFSTNMSCTNVGRAWSCVHLTNASLPSKAGSAHAGGGDGDSNAIVACGRRVAARLLAVLGSTSLNRVSIAGLIMHRPSEGWDKRSDSNQNWPGTPQLALSRTRYGACFPPK